jgi:hypothetical protein
MPEPVDLSAGGTYGGNPPHEHLEQLRLRARPLPSDLREPHSALGRLRHMHATQLPAASQSTSRPGQLVKLFGLVGLIVVALIAAGCGSGDTVEADAQTPATTPVDDQTETGNTGAADGDGAQGDNVEGDDDVVTTDPTPTSVDEPTPTPQATPTPAPSVPPTVVVAVFTSGGFVPVDLALRAFPELVVLSDGTVYQAAPQIAVFPPPLVPALERIDIGADGVADVIDVMNSSGLLDGDADFGSPTVTDAATTVLTSFVDGETELSAYALGLDDIDLDDASQQARSQLSATIDEIQAIVDAAGNGEAALPPAMAVLTFAGLGFQEDTAARAWPIDSVPESTGGGPACVTISGDELDVLVAAAADATTQTPWNIAGQLTAVVLRPVFPHEDGC